MTRMPRRIRGAAGTKMRRILTEEAVQEEVSDERRLDEVKREDTSVNGEFSRLAGTGEEVFAAPPIKNEIEMVTGGIKSEVLDIPVKHEIESLALKHEIPGAASTADLSAADSQPLEPPILDIENVVPPPHFDLFIERIRKMRELRQSPVDTVGCSNIAKNGKGKFDAKTLRFQSLIGLMLSSQTKDEYTYAAVERLQKHLNPTLTAESLLTMDELDLANMLNPVGFYRRKATFIQKAARICLDKYEGDVPRTIEEIVALPGVGPKMGHLLLQVAWDQVDGIGVDVHIHRLAQMWNWVPKSEHPNPEKTRIGLERWMPKSMWREINPLLVGFGQTWCPSRQTEKHCSECLLNDICPVSKVKTAKTTTGFAT